MAWTDWFKDRLKRHKRSASRARDAAAKWYRAEGKQELQKLANSVVAVLTKYYGDEAKAIVRGIRDFEIPISTGETYSTAFIRELLDRNKDGKVSLADVPVRYLNALREQAVQIVEVEDGNIWDGINELFDALEGK